MNLTVLTPPVIEPVTIAEAFVELRLGGPDDDFEDHPDYASVKGKLKAARQVCENETHRAFVPQTLRLSGSVSDWGVRRSIDLLRPPVISILAVTYYDASNAMQIIDPANYYAPGGQGFALMAGYAMPALYARPDALRIDYVAGYAPLTGANQADPQYWATGVEEPIKQAILLTLRLLYQNLDPPDRDATERARNALLWPYKVPHV